MGFVLEPFRIGASYLGDCLRGVNVGAVEVREILT